RGDRRNGPVAGAGLQADGFGNRDGARQRSRVHDRRGRRPQRRRRGQAQKRSVDVPVTAKCSSSASRGPTQGTPTTRASSTGSPTCPFLNEVKRWNDRYIRLVAR